MMVAEDHVLAPLLILAQSIWDAQALFKPLCPS